MKEYTIKAHQTKYGNVVFRSRLEARWAAYFDLCDWDWEYEPIDLMGWTPDFMVYLPCDHYECGDTHKLLVEVKPYYSIEEFEGHPCMDYPYGTKYNSKGECTENGIPADASAAFGINPSVTYWQMVHGDGGGIYSVEGWGDHDIVTLWEEAGNIVQYLP